MYTYCTLTLHNELSIRNGGYLCCTRTCTVRVRVTASEREEDADVLLRERRSNVEVADSNLFYARDLATSSDEMNYPLDGAVGGLQGDASRVFSATPCRFFLLSRLLPDVHKLHMFCPDGLELSFCVQLYSTRTVSCYLRRYCTEGTVQ